MGFTRPALRRAGFALKFNQEQKQVLGESDPQQRKHDPLQAHTQDGHKNKESGAHHGKEITHTWTGTQRDRPLKRIGNQYYRVSRARHRNA